MTHPNKPHPGYAAAAVAAARCLTDNPAFIRVLDPPSPAPATPGAPTSGPLDGVPFAVKDNIDVAGVPTTAACPALTTPAHSNAKAVELLVEAGAVPIGKTNMDQFATGLVGTRSPYGACHCVDSTTHVSGGSSSGSAVAVASGVVPFALGTDTAGSGRVPAAFNGIVGYKPTRGLVSTRGVLPACPSLDCVSVFTRTVSLARDVHDVIAGYDAQDPWSRARLGPRPPTVAAVMGVVGVPSGPIDLDAAHRAAWESALLRFAGVVRLVPVDVEPMLEVARMLYEPPFVAERLAAFGQHLEPDGPHLDPTVRRVVLAARGVEAKEVFTARTRLVELARRVTRETAGVDALLLPTTPYHPTLGQVAADPVGVNSRLGTYTNMTNLLDLCAVAIPAGRRLDGLPFGVQLLAPAWADLPLLALAEVLTGERGSSTGPPLGEGREPLAVCGAHLAGEPLNAVLTDAGATLHRRLRTAPGYRMVRLDGRLPRPGLLDDGSGPAEGIEVEVWDAPSALVRTLARDVDPPLEIGVVRLADGSTVAGFVARASVWDAPDISAAGSWRMHLAGQRVRTPTA